MDINPIKTDADHKNALREIDRLWTAPEGSPESDRLDMLVTLVEAYEQKRWPMEEEGDPVEIILAHMDVTGRTQADLANLLGSRSRASEILSRKRALTLEMIHKLHKEWGISANILVQPYKLDAA
ncbi:MAG: helix-turn-helix domain-containing protein [Devosia sp.]